MSRRLDGERIGVLGLARSGAAAARLALARGATVYASDAGQSDAAESLRALGADVETGGHDVEKLAACARIVLSPGIPPSAAILREPALAAVPIVPELEFAWEQMEVPTIAVTGTNGKTTITSMIHHLLISAGRRSVAAGNIGTALSEVALREPQPEVIVVEASSFQLGRCRTFAPDVGVLTNLAPDHLDWYDSVAEYYADKGRLFQNATESSRWIVNGEDRGARGLLASAPGERFWFRIETPLSSAERGGFLDAAGWLTLRMGGGQDERVLRADELRVLGPHNVANALAAAIAARMFGVEPHEIAEALRAFTAPEHRMEPIGERGGVLWINDSKATNIASTRVALRSLVRPTILLLGGKHKGEPYTQLLPDMEGRVRTVVAFGEAGERIEADLRSHFPVERVAGGIDEVVRRAAEIAEPGDAVLLSPACSSFDMFTNYEERGRRFRELVLEGDR